MLEISTGSLMPVAPISMILRASISVRGSFRHNEEVQLWAFDILVEGSDDLRKLPLHLRKTSLERLLARRPEGIFVNPFERGEIGPDLYRAACRMGLEGIVSKRRDRSYQGGRSKHWVKIKNRQDQAMDREFWPACFSIRNG
jgi:bifunctional non-homologous end joining protein LigD